MKFLPIPITKYSTASSNFHSNYFIYLSFTLSFKQGYIEERGGRGRMVVGFTTSYAIGAYHHYSCEFEPCSWQGVLDTTLCDKSLSVT